MMLAMVAIASAASAQDFSRSSAGCLTKDSALKYDEGLAPRDAAAVVTISPPELSSDNQPLNDVPIQMSLPAEVQLNNPIAVSLTVNSITGGQVSENNLAAPACESPADNQGVNWTPIGPGGLFASGSLQTAADAVSIAGVQLPPEPCSNLGTPVYQISFTCCDDTNGVCDDSVQVLNVPMLPQPSTGVVHHYEYVFPDGNLYVYDMDNHFRLVKHLSIPTGAGVRGTVASTATGRLYVSYGSDYSGNPPGSMLAYDLGNDTVLWTQNYPFGIDSMSISPDGRKIYMPTGELTSGGIWEILNGGTGRPIGSINSGGRGPHNTVVSLDGSEVFMGPRGSNYLVMADTTTNRVIRQIGPVADGVRPFTINGRNTLAFITTTGFLGFAVGNINSGRILYTIQVHGFPTTGGAASAPSHGISLSPDEKEIYLIDSINSYVHVFDVSGLPASPPRQVADIKLKGKISGNEQGCAYDCLKDGWLHHSRNGRYVFVGDSGDVVDTSLRKTVATLPAMANSRKEIELDIQNGKTVWAMNNRSSIGMHH